jgi:2-keto-4-pentenoate hydratase/2-oxohepta-3-ene-1,7-dioic acid hydratase in catechol pathway
VAFSTACYLWKLDRPDAGDYVFGVTAGNDVSARDWQGADIQRARAKGSRTFNAVGPHLVTGLDHENLNIEGRHKGERVQGENTSDMIFSVNYMLSYISISRYFTLQPGDTYEVEVEGVGVLSNPVVQGR